MRVASKSFGQRTTFFSENQEPRSKYILVYEGEETEVQYFDGILENKEDFIIDKLIEIVPLLRSYNQKSFSHPNKILELLEEYLNHNLNNNIMVETFAEYIIDYMIGELDINEKNILNPKILKSEILNHFHNIGLEPNNYIDDLSIAISSVTNYLKQKINLSESIDDIQKYIQDQQIVYNKEIDKVCLIFDRDSNNFKEHQYDSVVLKCKTLNYNLYISNPCFEFWLLLHSSNISQISNDDLLQNRKVSKRSKKRFLEVELTKNFIGYKKNNIKFDRFKPFIKLAISQEENYCEDIAELKTKLGSNIGLLLKNILV